MIYELMIRARNDAGIAVETRHRAFCRALKKLSIAWSALKLPLPPVKSPPPDELASINLTRLLPDVKQAQVTYVSREATDDDDCNDDFFCLAFSPGKLDYQFVVQKLFIPLLEPFGAYVGNILAEDVSQLDFEKGLKNGRQEVQRLSPVCFFDQTLCRRAFKLSLGQLTQRLSEQAERVIRMNNGILVIATSQAPTVLETQAIHNRLRRCLRPTLPGRGRKVARRRGT